MLQRIQGTPLVTRCPEEERAPGAGAFGLRHWRGGIGAKGRASHPRWVVEGRKTIDNLGVGIEFDPDDVGAAGGREDGGELRLGWLVFSRFPDIDESAVLVGIGQNGKAAIGKPLAVVRMQVCRGERDQRFGVGQHALAQ